MDSFWSWKDSGRRGALACLMVAGTILGCRTVSVELAAPEVARLNAPVARTGELETGRLIYTGRQKCARCHRPKPVTGHTAAEWTETILPREAKRAKLTDVERQYVLSYILTARSIGNQSAEAR